MNHIDEMIRQLRASGALDPLQAEAAQLISEWRNRIERVAASTTDQVAARDLREMVGRAA
jgi:hypothetical protein